MSLLYWVAAAWLVAAVGLTVAFFAAKRSKTIYSWLFGERPAAEVHRMTEAAGRASKQPTRLAA